MKVGILTHMGLGDHLICNGLVRHFAGIKQEVVVYAKYHNVPSVIFMYRDLPNVSVVGVADDNDAWRKQEPVTIRTGIFLGPDWNVTKCFCYSFYVNAGLDRSLMHTGFYVQRNLESEEAFYKKVTDHIGTDKYIVLHEDPSRFQPIRGVDETKYPVIRICRGYFPIGSESIFDYCTLIERAQEFHCYDGCFSMMTELLHLRSKEHSFLHRYVRENNDPNTEEFMRFTIVR
jgi:hypothetical protein